MYSLVGFCKFSKFLNNLFQSKLAVEGTMITRYVTRDHYIDHYVSSRVIIIPSRVIIIPVTRDHCYPALRCLCNQAATSELSLIIPTRVDVPKGRRRSWV